MVHDRIARAPAPLQAPLLSVRDVIDALAEPMARRGFHRSDPFMAEATSEDRWVASWLREPADEQVHDMRWPDGTIAPVGFYDGVSVWSGGYVNVGMQGNRLHVRIEWRNSGLDGDEFACVVTGVVDQTDRFLPHTGPPLRRGGWTRD